MTRLFAFQETARLTDMALLCEGQVVGGTYEVERLGGEGAFAEVYRVRHRFLGRQGAKVLKMVAGSQHKQELGGPCDSRLLPYSQVPGTLRLSRPDPRIGRETHVMAEQTVYEAPGP